METSNKELNLKNIKKKLVEKKVDGYILSTSDEYLNEYPPLQNLRLKWLTGFSGSNGIVLILKNMNIFFTDGRYTLQAKNELPQSFQIFESKKETIFTWIKKNLRKKNIIIDNKIHSISIIRKFQEVFKESNNEIVFYKKIFIDELWKNRPKECVKNAFTLSKKFSGITEDKKLKKVKESIKKFDLFLVTSPESIAWLLNLRGADLKYTPLVFSRLLIQKDSKHKLFINKEKISQKLHDRLSKFGIRVFSEEKIEEEIKKIKKTKKICLDINSPYFFYEILKKINGNVYLLNDPCKKLKSIKNCTELNNSKKAHIIDGIALIKFFCWFENQKTSDQFNEISVAKKLEYYRRNNKNFLSLSFPTISSSGKNGAIIHYNPTKETNTVIKSGDIFLCDSGAQYKYGTTDITRTVYVGSDSPSNTLKEWYTRVLMGQINLTRLIFPTNTKGVQIDAFARYYLWSVGEDYNHGTGHGVGSFLGVHEGPQSISKSLTDVNLEPGMIVSNEPGIYKENQFGIRIENLVLVKKAKKKNFLEFETLTLVPLENKLIERKLLNHEQIMWINKYHKKILKNVYEHLEKEEKDWLLKKTKMI